MSASHCVHKHGSVDAAGQQKHEHRQQQCVCVARSQQQCVCACSKAKPVCMCCSNPAHVLCKERKPSGFRHPDKCCTRAATPKRARTRTHTRAHTQKKHTHSFALTAMRLVQPDPLFKHATHLCNWAWQRTFRLSPRHGVSWPSSEATQCLVL